MGFEGDAGGACGLIQDVRHGEAVVLLIGAHRAFRLGPLHAVNAAGIMSGGGEPFLGAFALLLGGERWPRADALADVEDDQLPYDE
jgi:hypothetical protein